MKININEEVARQIKAIGEDLIKRAEDISKDLENVTQITIFSIIEDGTITNYDVTKNYSVKGFIHHKNSEE